ncbi:MAG: FKBP-type peptidyl-prolyl cis-trans isomerase [Lachnospiraceae bacterium]|nr:FKBP-type peptidyl-prolyl cis-trans isomerase [Lachnospiraceae bacterium]
MKKPVLPVLLLTAAAVLGGCGGSSESKQAASEAVSAASVNDNVTDEITESEGTVESYPDDDVLETENFVVNSDSAPTTSEEPQAGSFDSFVSLGSYDGLEIQAEAGTAIESGMTANIDYVGKIGGTEYEGGSGSRYDYMVGLSMFGEDFDKALTGHKAGDTFTVSISYPGDYYDDVLAGQTVDFDVTVNAVYITTPDVALMNVVENSTVLQYPSSLVDALKAQYLAQFRSENFDESAAESALIEENGFPTEDEFDAFIRSNVKNQLVYLAMMDKEGITKDSDTFAAARVDALTRNGLASSVSEALSGGYTELDIDLMAEEYLAQQILASKAAS